MQCKEVVNKEGLQYHICCKKGDVGRYVLLPGDPFRTDLIAKYLEEPVLVAHNREHKTWTGYLDGVKVSVTSTGMGGPSAAIAIEELIHCGADTFIRIGTCGRVCEDSMDQTLDGVIITGAIRDEGTTRQYIPIEYPAIANRTVLEALVEAAKDAELHYAEGIAHCKDSFYGQHDPNGLPNAKMLLERWDAWKAGNTMASEMETSTLFVISSIRKARAGAIMAYGVMNNQTIEVACNAIRKLIKQEKEGKH